jgi:arginyl-tRNA--protein-N-Asp/Glu arginylyltransferase
MRHTLPIAPQFYVTAPQPCPYLDGRMERKLFTALQGDTPIKLNDALSQQGFRRSQNVLYRPSCAECSACLSARIRRRRFHPPAESQRRTRKRNADRSARRSRPGRPRSNTLCSAAISTTPRRWRDGRHGYLRIRRDDRGNADPQPRRGISATRSRWPDDLVAVSLTDVLDDGLSMVYSFYAPDQAPRLAWHLHDPRSCRYRPRGGLPYVYLGYWVPGSQRWATRPGWARWKSTRTACGRISATGPAIPPMPTRWPSIRSSNRSRGSACPTQGRGGRRRHRGCQSRVAERGRPRRR